MSTLKTKKELIARILKCGVSRVRLDPQRSADIDDAITAADIRRLLKDGIIWKEPKKGLSNFRKNKAAAQKKKGRRKGAGSRKGHMANKEKAVWMSRIRAQRKLLKELRSNNKIDKPVFRALYKKAKGGLFRSRSHLKTYIERNKMLKEGVESV